MLDDLLKKLEEPAATKIPKQPVVRERVFVDEDGKEMLFQTIEIQFKEYIDLIKDKAYEEGYSWGMQQTLDKIFGTEEE